MRIFYGLLVLVFLMVPVAQAQNFTDVSAWGRHSLALTSTGDVFAWGRSHLGQAGGAGDILTPQQVSLPRDATAIAAGRYHSVALLDNGTVWTWGGNDRGQLGYGTMDSFAHAIPQQVTIPFNDTVVWIGAGEKHTFAVTDDGEIYGWGWNHDGQLGVGNDDTQTSPTQTLSISNGTRATGGYDWALMLQSNGTLRSAGENRYGQLGNNSSTDTESNPPTTVHTISNVSQMSAGYGHAVALNGSSLYAWGRSSAGQTCVGLSGGTVVARTPRLVSLSSVAQGEAGGSHTLIRRTNGDVYSCGTGDSTGHGGLPTTIYSTPTRIIALSNIASIAAGRYHSLAVDTNGRVFAWGDNTNGQLGIGLIGGSLSIPFQVN